MIESSLNPLSLSGQLLLNNEVAVSGNNNTNASKCDTDEKIMSDQNQRTSVGDTVLSKKQVTSQDNDIDFNLAFDVQSILQNVNKSSRELFAHFKTGIKKPYNMSHEPRYHTRPYDRIHGDKSQQPSVQKMTVRKLLAARKNQRGLFSSRSKQQDAQKTNPKYPVLCDMLRPTKQGAKPNNATLTKLKLQIRQKMTSKQVKKGNRVPDLSPAKDQIDTSPLHNHIQPRHMEPTNQHIDKHLLPPQTGESGSTSDEDVPTPRMMTASLASDSQRPLSVQNKLRDHGVNPLLRNLLRAPPRVKPLQNLESITNKVKQIDGDGKIHTHVDKYNSSIRDKCQLSNHIVGKNVRLMGENNEQVVPYWRVNRDGFTCRQVECAVNSWTSRSHAVNTDSETPLRSSHMTKDTIAEVGFKMKIERDNCTLVDSQSNSTFCTRRQHLNPVLPSPDNRLPDPNSFARETATPFTKSNGDQSELPLDLSKSKVDSKIESRCKSTEDDMKSKSKTMPLLQQDLSVQKTSLFHLSVNKYPKQSANATIKYTCDTRINGYKASNVVSSLSISKSTQNDATDPVSPQALDLTKRLHEERSVRSLVHHTNKRHPPSPQDEIDMSLYLCRSERGELLQSMTSQRSAKPDVGVYASVSASEIDNVENDTRNESPKADDDQLPVAISTGVLKSQEKVETKMETTAPSHSVGCGHEIMDIDILNRCIKQENDSIPETNIKNEARILKESKTENSETVSVGDTFCVERVIYNSSDNVNPASESTGEINYIANSDTIEREKALLLNENETVDMNQCVKDVDTNLIKSEPMGIKAEVEFNQQSEDTGSRVTYSDTCLDTRDDVSTDSLTGPSDLSHDLSTDSRNDREPHGSCSEKLSAELSELKRLCKPCCVLIKDISVHDTKFSTHNTNIRRRQPQHRSKLANCCERTGKRKKRNGSDAYQPCRFQGDSNSPHRQRREQYNTRKRLCAKLDINNPDESNKMTPVLHAGITASASCGQMADDDVTGTKPTTHARDHESKIDVLKRTLLMKINAVEEIRKNCLQYMKV